MKLPNIFYHLRSFRRPTGAGLQKTCQRFGLWLALHALALPCAFGAQVEFGVSLLEEGDNRLRGGYVLNVGSKDYRAHLLYFSRSYGPVLQTTTGANIMRAFPVPYYRNLEAAIGLAMLAEGTTISYALEADRAYDQKDVQYNAGFAAGLYWVQNFAGAWHLRLAWESTIFPAGLLGGLFLVSGRKQYLYLATGVSL